MYGDASRAVDVLLDRSDELCVIAQNLIEFWSVATRPMANNGLDFSIARTIQEVAKLKTVFVVLPDTANILPEWERLVVNHQVLGKQVYDARLVAAMSVHHVTHLLTFNTDDFKRFTTITAVNPQSILNQ